MDDVDEHKFYGDSTILEPIVEQQDDEVIYLCEERKSIKLFLLFLKFSSKRELRLQ